MIFFSTLLGILLGEWKGTSSRTRKLLALGLFLLLGSYVAVGYSGYAKQTSPAKPVARSVFRPERGRNISAQGKRSAALGGAHDNSSALKGRNKRVGA